MNALFVKKQVPFDLSEINILNADDQILMRLSKENQFAFSLEEMKSIQQHYKKLNRNPTDVEIEAIAQTWSEHCYHKTFKGEIVTEDGIINNLFETYIAKVAEELKYSWLFLAFKDNAGIVDFADGYSIAIKVETHNHPSAIEPFGGAATGVGGVIRDVLGVWAEPIANTDVLCFGPLDYDYNKLPADMKHPKLIYGGVTAGVGSYGNCMGIPTVNGAIYFDEGYVGNPLVYCGCIGLLPKDKFVKNVKVGDVLIIAGNKTGRDGIHGVTFASLEIAEKSDVSRPAVQIPDPLQEEKLKRAILEVRDRKLASAITDVGGGGISCGSCELAQTSDIGISVFLDSVPLREKLVPWEIFISESQERMLLVVPDDNLSEVLQIFSDEDVEATPIGKFIQEKTAKISYKGTVVGELDLEFLFNPITTTKKAVWKEPEYKEPTFAEPINLTEILLKLLSQPNIASKESVVRTYDHEVKGSTVLKPLHGEFSGPNDAAVLKPLANSRNGIVISSGMNPSYGKIDPYWMAASAVDEAIRNNISAGGRRIALLDNFCWGNPDKPDRLGGLVRAAKACYDVAKVFQTPFISGKDSLYNESPLGAVTPSLLITALGIIPDVKKAVSVDLKKPGDLIYIVGKTYPELGGSEYYKLNGYIGNYVPKVNPEESKKIFDAITVAIDAGYVKACHDISEGGLAVALAEMAFSSRYGVELDLTKVPVENINRNDFILFSESNSRFLVEVNEGDKDKFEGLLKGVSYGQIGRVIGESILTISVLNEQKLISTSTDSLRSAWKKTLN
ncbi:MAG: phosphoribosylformylglycinamidine synthase subunit PurL [Candidatus Aenigmarchaeota archaeon]|nr:phosphoribosylformylglycinamidine synthase subunit PurL [Candidatus Aenigmarchaeota archaeon]